MANNAARTDIVPRLFDRVATLYDSEALQRIVYRPAQDEVIEALRLRKPARVLDVGCGTGQLTARIAAELAPEVVYGCDMADGMLAQAAARSATVEWLRGPAEHVPLPDGAVDAVVSTHAFHFFDQPAALAEFHRLLSPGGTLALAVLSPRSALGSRLQDMSTFGRAHWPTERELTGLIEAAGFTIDSQRRARRPLGRYIPDLVTVATRP